MSVGELDISAHFLYTPLVEEKDGVFLVSPPAILQRVVWQHKKALYGLRVAPKKVDANSG